jgi:hypothetical protein
MTGTFIQPFLVRRLMVNPKTINISLLAAGLLLCLPPQAFSAADAARVQADARKQVEIRQATQKMSERFSEKRQALADRLEALQKELKAVSQQRRKTEAYVDDMTGRVNELKRRTLEMERLEKELEPFLDQAGEGLREVVARDLPFMAKERRKRLDDLKGTLNRFGAPTGVKLRGLLDALEIEARYGSTVSCHEAELDINGSREIVRVFRLGRLALFTLSSDGSRAWRYDQGKGKFLPLADYQGELNMAADMASRKKVVELVELPVGQPAAALQDGKL